MSEESLEQFLAQVDASEDLQEKIGEEIDNRCNGPAGCRKEIRVQYG